MNSEAIGGDYNQGDKEWEQLGAQDQLNAEYGNELGDIDAELAAKQAIDRTHMQNVGQQAMNPVPEQPAADVAAPQVTQIPAEDPDKIRAAAEFNEAIGTPMPEAGIETQVNNVDAALTDPNAQRATDEQLDKEYNEIEGQAPSGPTPGDIAGTGESAGQQVA